MVELMYVIVKSSLQVSKVVFKARPILAMLNTTLVRLTFVLFMPSYSAMVSLLLGYCGQAWLPTFSRDIDKLARFQRALFMTRIWPVCTIL